jgi:phosphoacetylglucosamine mutase
VAAVEKEERERWGGLPTAAALYGTAGFRGRADKLDRVVFRGGVLAALRSRATKATVGVMITASHNPVQDNGVKVVEPLGEMLVQEWESLATRLANTSTENLHQVVEEIVQTAGLDAGQPATILLARDNRPSGDHLRELLVRGVEIMGAECTDYGVLTTPQLHYMVRCVNTSGSYGTATEEGYYRKIASAFHMLLPEPSAFTSLVKVDAANGVGGASVKRVMEEVKSDLVTVRLYNNGSGVLNDRCGADYVKIGQTAPNGVEFLSGDLCASFDGDADRIVYFCKNSDGQFQLLDGDRIAALASLFISEQLQALPFTLSLGVVQTAYANGGSSRFLEKDLGVPVACTSTGVKHLHHRAAMFDIGVYFEANGHGTVLFSARAQERLSAATEDAEAVFYYWCCEAMSTEKIVCVCYILVLEGVCSYGNVCIRL